MTPRVLAYVKQNVLGFVAIFIALSGVTYAAADDVLPRDSVDSGSVKNRSLQGIDLGEGTIKSQNLDRPARSTGPGPSPAATSRTASRARATPPATRRSRA